MHARKFGRHVQLQHGLDRADRRSVQNVRNAELRAAHVRTVGREELLQITERCFDGLQLGGRAQLDAAGLEDRRYGRIVSVEQGAVMEVQPMVEAGALGREITTGGVWRDHGQPAGRLVSISRRQIGTDGMTVPDSRAPVDKCRNAMLRIDGDEFGVKLFTGQSVDATAQI